MESNFEELVNDGLDPLLAQSREGKWWTLNSQIDRQNNWRFLSRLFQRVWSNIQGARLMEDGEDELNLAAPRRAEQQGGNPLFRAEFQAIGSPRWWHGGAPNAERFRLNTSRIKSS